MNASITPPPAEIAAIRSVHRAVTELRRGAAVVLDSSRSVLVLAAETLPACSLELAQRLGGHEALLLLGESRAETLVSAHGKSGPVRAFRLPAALNKPETLRRLADPTLDQIFAAPLEPAAAPAEAMAAVQLIKLARLLPAALLFVLPDDAALAGLDLMRVGEAAVLDYPRSMATRLTRVAEARVPLDHAPNARIVAFRAPDAGIEHLAILIGEPELEHPDLVPPLVRVHSECFTGDLLGSLRCDCGPQLRGAIRRMGEEGRGVLLYLAQEGRGIGLVNKLRAYTMQDRGLDTLDANRALGYGADERNFLIAATMLCELGIPAVRLLTNNPDKVGALAACGVNVVAREGHVFAPNGVNDGYLATKALRFGHLFDS